jgi:DNA-binding IclR family transcriptional regulator
MSDLDFEGGVRSVQLGLDVLETVAFSGEELGVTQIAARLGVTKGSVHRHLLTFVQRGYLTQNPATQRYGVGPKSRVLASVAPEVDLAKIAAGPMRDLRDRVGQTVVLSSPTPRGALVISAVPGTSPIEIGVRPGSELSFHSSAQGRVLLAFSPPQFRKRIMASTLERLTDKTIADPARLEQTISRAVSDGYASAPEETLIGINAVAAPIFDRGGLVAGAVALVGSIQFLPADPNAETIAALKQCAELISRRLDQNHVK